jgi:hypothetical protein
MRTMRELSGGSIGTAIPGFSFETCRPSLAAAGRTWPFADGCSPAVTRALTCASCFTSRISIFDGGRITSSRPSHNEPWPRFCSIPRTTSTCRRTWRRYLARLRRVGRVRARVDGVPRAALAVDRRRARDAEHLDRERHIPGRPLWILWSSHCADSWPCFEGPALVRLPGGGPLHGRGQRSFRQALWIGEHFASQPIDCERSRAGTRHLSAAPGL